TEQTLQELKDLLKSKDLSKSVERLINEKTELEKKLELLEAEKTQVLKQVLKGKVVQQNGVSVLIERIDIPSVDQLKNLSFQLKNEIPELFCVFGTVLGDKPFLSVIIDEKLVREKGWNAGNIVKELAKEIKGGGGGQAFYATAGGTDITGLEKALNKAKTLI
ncbi:MAG TPA: alanine--tRNA ligase, partial [Bacteroidetes bacterium]|nr:alanine--tRNA ligase [Bacteroidota bacterium]